MGQDLKYGCVEVWGSALDDKTSLGSWTEEYAFTVNIENVSEDTVVMMQQATGGVAGVREAISQFEEWQDETKTPDSNWLLPGDA